MAKEKTKQSSQLSGRTVREKNLKKVGTSKESTSIGSPSQQQKKDLRSASQGSSTVTGKKGSLKKGTSQTSSGNQKGNSPTQSDTEKPETPTISEYSQFALIGNNQTVSAKIMMLEALEQCWSIVAPAAKMAGISRDIHYDWLKGDPEYKKAYESIKIVKKDLAEYLVVSSAMAGDARCRVELNKKLNRDRGYGDKLEVTGGLNPTVQNKKIFIPHNGRDQKNTMEILAASSEPTVSGVELPGTTQQTA